MKTKYPERAHRLRIFFNHLNIRNKTVSLRLGIPNAAFVSQLLNGHSTVTADIARRLKKVFPDLNTDWLLDGTGEMLVVKSYQIEGGEPRTLEDLEKDYKNDPLFSLKAMLNDYGTRIAALEEKLHALEEDTKVRGSGVN